MNITFLIGNGFDKALGLKTGYSDFYEWYVKQKTPEKPARIGSFKTELDKFVRKEKDAKCYWSDAEIGFADYTEEFTEDEIEDFMECYEDFRERLMEYLILETAKISDDLAQKMCEKFFSQLYNFYQEVDPVEQDVFTKLRKGERSETKLNIISFNYTDSINKIHSALSKRAFGSWQGNDGRSHAMTAGTLIHAHGYTDTWPIIGVCNPASIKNQALLNNALFRAMMIKSESIINTGELWRTQTSATIQNSDVICIFGMSLGSTDSDYWKMIVDWLRGGSSRQLIVFWRNSKIKNFRTSIKSKLTEKSIVLNKLIDNSGEQPDILEKIKNQIHIVFNAKKMFSLPEELKTTGNSSDSSNAETEIDISSDGELLALLK